jgi:hypothetical protein
LARARLHILDKALLVVKRSDRLLKDERQTVVIRLLVDPLLTFLQGWIVAHSVAFPRMTPTHASGF